MPNKVVVTSFNDKKKCDVWTKNSLFVFNNYPLLHLFKLITTSPLINLYTTQTQKSLSDHVRCFYVLFCLPSFTCASSLSLVLHECRCDYLQYKVAQGSHVFSRLKKKKSCMWSICTDVCAEVSGDFHPNFHYTKIRHYLLNNLIVTKLIFLSEVLLYIRKWGIFLIKCSL